MTESLRAFVERMSRFTTLADEFNAETPEGEALREEYGDEDAHRADVSDDRLLDELHCFEEMIRDAREVLAQPDPMRDALEAAEHWIEEQAWSPIAENGEILRTIRDALGKPHDAPDAAPAAPQTPDDGPEAAPGSTAPLVEFLCVGTYDDDGSRFADSVHAYDATGAESTAEENWPGVTWAGFVALRDGVMTVEG